MGIVKESGRFAGIKLGDRILRVNGKEYTHNDEFFNALNREIGSLNTYLIDRDGRKLEISIPIARHGFQVAFTQSGLYLITGLCYLFVGSIVFLMKSYDKTARVFFVTCAVLGSLITYFAQMGEIQPAFLNLVHILLYTLSPAVIIHLAMFFPQKQTFIKKYPYIEFLPYLGSTILFLGIRSTKTQIVGIPKAWYLFLNTYFVLALIIFLSANICAWINSTSAVTKVRSKLILLSVTLTASLPIADMLANTLWNVYIVPSYNYYLPFLLIFPIYAGYGIIKHNLFDINAIIRQTFYYLIFSAGIILLYFSVIIFFSLFLGDVWQKKSHILILTIILIVMFSFGFICKRVQTHIDRIFFRLDFDYRETVSRISTAMSSLINVEQIVKFICDITENVLYANYNHIMLLNRNNNTYVCVSKPREVPSLSAREPLIQKIANYKREVTRSEIDANPIFAIDRKACQQTFQTLNACLIIPLIYENHLTGFIAIGEKKSGKLYKYEDVLLLKTLADQSALAIENARLFTDLDGQTKTLLKTNVKLEQEIEQRKRAEAELKAYKQQLEQKVARQRVELEHSQKTLADLKGDIEKGHRFGKMIGKNESMQAIYSLIKDIADVPATVLITGESGTGKELVAEALHKTSWRIEHPFVKVNCSALSESVLESELFGHVKGAFTGADKDKIGRFQKAANGTILLDEIGDVSLHFQKRLLRVLQEREFERVGDTKTFKMKARVLAATNQNLLEKVEQGSFRQDLYYRLKVVEIKLPALRDRKEDIPLLINHFIKLLNEDLGKKIADLSPNVLRLLMTYHWPGNIRELRNTLEHICIVCKNTRIEEGDLPLDFPGRTLYHDQSFVTYSDETKPILTNNDTVGNQKEILIKTLGQAQWNKTKTAEILSISRRTLYRRLKEYNLLESQQL